MSVHLPFASPENVVQLFDPVYDFSEVAHLLVSLIFRPRGVALTLLRERSLDQTIAVARGIQIARTPGHQANTNFIVEFRKVQLCLFPGRQIENVYIKAPMKRIRSISPLKHMVLGLLTNRGDAIKLAAIRIRFHDLYSGPTRRSPVHDPTWKRNGVRSLHIIQNWIIPKPHAPCDIT